MRNPSHPGWPDHGERTELEDVAGIWLRDYWRWVLDEHRMRVLGIAPKRGLRQASKDYLEHRAGVVERNTLSNDRTSLLHLWDDFGDRPVRQIDPQKTLDRLLREGYAVSTVRTMSAYLSSFWTWMDLPYKVKLPKAQQSDARALTDAEIVAVRKVAGADLLLVDLGLYMGLRLGEMYGLRWTDVDLAEWVVKVRRQADGKPLKSKKARTALILPGWEHEVGVGSVLDAMARTTQRTGLRRTLEDAGVYERGMGAHVYRHTYARLFLEAHPDMRLLQASLGHASITTTESTYNHLLPDRAAQMARERIHGQGSGARSGTTPLKP